MPKQTFIAVKNRRPLLARVVAVAIAAIVLYAPLATRADEWPEPAERSGPSVRTPREVDAALVLEGAYVPASVSATPDPSGIIGGALTWNFALVDRLGLFGHHAVTGFMVGNVSMLAEGNEVGLRYRAAQLVALEAAFLAHNISRVWVDDYGISPGGVEDIGGEIGAWLPFEPNRWIRLDAHLFFRIFDVYRDTQEAFGAGARLSLLVASGHSVVIEPQLVGVLRNHPREGVASATLNVIGDVSWRFALYERLGGMVGARFSTSMLVGVQPMLELKRSMIGEPMALGYLGIFFGG